ncbi:DUF1819 domain-containing protein [Myxococcus sp. CA039A]|uniref:DUF1819 domain-containing protein n=1 Tax=Myxococcus sp. CA039A TaxID=2741737 RepID=UPI00157A3ACE|nr:DUF1819 domain-containing protein [Myxococcus sp. CA039A]NTX50286.1 DUF1819 domain-containing protein [Myxococcus sp. CA039A]
MASAEVDSFHTRILRLTLAVQESRAYWEAVDPEVRGPARVERAFSERWFGNKSLARVKLLLANFAVRFDAYPDALAALRRWRPADPGTRPLLCHWHMQLADPLYRAFTGDWLPARLVDGRKEFDADAVARWVGARPDADWAPATRYGFATKLTRAAAEAGLVSTGKAPRSALLPRVPDEALGYLVRLLQVVTHTGGWEDNPYLRSVGLTHDAVDARLRRLPDVTYRRMGSLVELNASPLGALG